MEIAAAVQISRVTTRDGVAQRKTRSVLDARVQLLPRERLDEGSTTTTKIYLVDTALTASQAKIKPQQQSFHSASTHLFGSKTLVGVPRLWEKEEALYCT